MQAVGEAAEVVAPTELASVVVARVGKAVVGSAVVVARVGEAVVEAAVVVARVGETGVEAGVVVARAREAVVAVEVAAAALAVSACQLLPLAEFVAPFELGPGSCRVGETARVPKAVATCQQCQWMVGSSEKSQ